MYELNYFVYIPEKLEDAKKDLEELNRQKQDAVWSWLEFLLSVSEQWDATEHGINFPYQSVWSVAGSL